MIPSAVLCDFDGTIVPYDVSEELLEAHADRSWWDLDMAYRRGDIGSRECVLRQAALLPPDGELLLDDALARFAVDPDFPPFVTWCRERDIEITVVSDGFGFYIPAMLDAAGVTRLPVVTNRTSFAGKAPSLSFPNGNAICIGCGTCKMNAVQSARTRTGGPVAFVGEGHSDQYAAVYADLVFASKHLAEICESRDIAYVPWETFADVHDFIASELPWPQRRAPEPLECPGWFPSETASS